MARKITTDFTHWLTEKHYWGTSIRRVRVIAQTDRDVFFLNCWGLENRRAWGSVISLEPLDWTPDNGYELYLKAVELEQCFLPELLGAEVRELRVRIEHLFSKLQQVKYDSWTMRANDVLLDCAIWMPNVQVSREIYNQLTVNRFAQ